MKCYAVGLYTHLRYPAALYPYSNDTGYCFGAPFVCEAGGTGEIVAGSSSLLIANQLVLIHSSEGAVAHPASLNDVHFRQMNGRSLSSSCVCQRELD